MTVTKVHPYPAGTTMVVVYDLEEASRSTSSSVIPPHSLKLRRMPHLFAKVLQLPFDSDKDVEVHETPECYVFEIQQSGLVAEDMQVKVLEIVPGAVKVLIGGVELMPHETQLNCWRFRLPPTTSPEETRVEIQGEVLVITVPKLGGGASREVFLN